MDKYLIQLSSGLDSLGAFFALMKDNPPEKGSKLTFIHVQLRETLGLLKGQNNIQYTRWIVQLECALRQYKYIKDNYKDYDVEFISPYVYSDSGWKTVGHDIYFLHTITYNLACIKKYDYVVRGGATIEAEKFRQEYAKNAPNHVWVKSHVATDYFSFSDEVKRIFSIIYSEKINELKPTKGYDTYSLLELIPKELHSILWICQAPVLEGSTVSCCSMSKCAKCIREPYKIFNTIELEHTLPIVENYKQYLDIMEQCKSI
jgi:hypothetical protein